MPTQTFYHPNWTDQYPKNLIQSNPKTFFGNVRTILSFTNREPAAALSINPDMIELKLRSSPQISSAELTVTLLCLELILYTKKWMIILMDLISSLPIILTYRHPTRDADSTYPHSNENPEELRLYYFDVDTSSYGWARLFDLDTNYTTPWWYRNIGISSAIHLYSVFWTISSFILSFLSKRI